MVIRSIRQARPKARRSAVRVPVHGRKGRNRACGAPCGPAGSVRSWRAPVDGDRADGRINDPASHRDPSAHLSRLRKRMRDFGEFVYARVGEARRGSGLATRRLNGGSAQPAPPEGFRSGHPIADVRGRPLMPPNAEHPGDASPIPTFFVSRLPGILQRRRPRIERAGHEQREIMVPP